MRIIAGKHKGLRLKEFDFVGTRPTPDKVREAIFNKIQFNINDAVCLDLFGGTGVCSIEFLSRGAKSVYICDVNLKSINLIKENLKRANENAVILNFDYKKCIQKLSAEIKFDIIFLDPPFNSDYGEQAIKLIDKYELLKNDGIIIYECEKDTKFNLGNFNLLDKRTYGRIEVNYLVK